LTTAHLALSPQEARASLRRDAKQAGRGNPARFFVNAQVIPGRALRANPESRHKRTSLDSGFAREVRERPGMTGSKVELIAYVAVTK
jgi:hypothetical protein